MFWQAEKGSGKKGGDFTTAHTCTGHICDCAPPPGPKTPILLCPHLRPPSVYQNTPPPPPFEASLPPPGDCWPVKDGLTSRRRKFGRFIPIKLDHLDQI